MKVFVTRKLISDLIHNYSKSYEEAYFLATSIEIELEDTLKTSSTLSQDFTVQIPVGRKNKGKEEMTIVHAKHFFY